MTKPQYTRYRIVLAVATLAWIVLGIFAVTSWESLSVVAKGALGLLGLFLIPDVTMVEQVFVSYERYEREGL